MLIGANMADSTAQFEHISPADEAMARLEFGRDWYAAAQHLIELQTVQGRPANPVTRMELFCGAVTVASAEVDLMHLNGQGEK
jgi:hypothetical protein